ncbi:leucine-rich repeat-containing protein 15-like, partial [Asbolus verrucosus]
MEIISVMFLLGLTGSSITTHCDKELNYHENYGYGFDVTCEGLTNANDRLLRNISVSNEIVLKINNSNLTKVTASLFQNIQKIRYLTITNSTFSYEAREEPFVNLHNLQHLTVENTYFNELNAHTFQRLNALKELNLFNNSIRSIERDTFKFLENLEVLKLSQNYLKSVYDVPVCELPKLKHFHLDHNQIQILEKSYFFCFHKSDSFGIHLNKQKYEVTSTKSKFFRQMNSTLNLITLDLSYNNINKIEIFDWAFKLKHISLENNKLTTITDKLFSLVDDLERVNLKNNLIESISPRAFIKLVRLKYINLENNKLSDVHLENLPNLEEINLSKNKLISSSLKHINHLPKAKTLLLNDNKLEELPLSIFQNYSSLEILDLSNNNLSLHNLHVLDIAGNRLQNFQFDLISALPSLRVINIKSNLLSCDVLSNIITFLKSKDISYNINEEFEYEKKNIDGIYCEEMSERMQENSSVNHGRLPSALGILFFVVASSVLISLVIYKFLQFSRRRRYIMDEIELIE